jgi:hypothetical protein
MNLVQNTNSSCIVYCHHSMKSNHLCYQFQKRVYTDGIFNNAIDATYIIHLSNNGRESHIENQLSMYHPTDRIFLVINQGYKSCSKSLPEQKPAHDLTDSFLQIFQHANEENYNHILILEDDFEFHPKIKNPEIQREISDFLNSKHTDKFLYYLGCLPYLQSTGFSNHNRLYLSGGTHACIYSRPLRNFILESYKSKDIVDWDVFHNCNLFHYPRFVYKEPLCYQLFSFTENSNHWYNPFGLADGLKQIHQYFQLDKKVEPGHQIFYNLSKFIYVFLLFLFSLPLIILIWLTIREKGGKKRK